MAKQAFSAGRRSRQQSSTVLDEQSVTAKEFREEITGTSSKDPDVAAGIPGATRTRRRRNRLYAKRENAEAE